MDKLALFGGKPVRSKPFPSWPSFTGELKAQLINTMEKDTWGVGSDIIKKFEERYAEFHDAKYALSTSSGTTALWVCLKAAGVKAGDEVILAGRAQVRHIPRHEAGVGEPHLCGFRPSCGETFLTDVIAGEPAVGEGLGHQVDGVAVAAANVGDVDARL